MSTKLLFRGRYAGVTPLIALVAPAFAQGYPATPYPASRYPTTQYPGSSYPATPVAAPYRAPYQASISNDPADQLSMHLRTLALAPRSLSALLGAGQAALAGGDPTAALGFFARAEQVDASGAAAKAGLAASLVALEKPDDALRLFGEANRLGMPDSTIAKDRALAYDLRGDTRAAQRDYALALRATPGDPETVRRYALSLGIGGDRAAALAQLEPLLRRKDPGAWRARAFILALTGDVEGADAIVRQMMPAGMAAQMVPFMKRLAALNPADRAHAVNFGTMPAAGQSYASVQTGDPYRGPAVAARAPAPAPTGFDGRRVAVAEPVTRALPAPTSSTGSALVPQGEPLGTRSRLAPDLRVARRSDVPIVTVPGVATLASPAIARTTAPVSVAASAPTTSPPVALASGSNPRTVQSAPASSVPAVVPAAVPATNATHPGAPIASPVTSASPINAIASRAPGLAARAEVEPRPGAALANAPPARATFGPAYEAPPVMASTATALPRAMVPEPLAATRASTATASPTLVVTTPAAAPVAAVSLPPLGAAPSTLTTVAPTSVPAIAAPASAQTFTAAPSLATPTLTPPSTLASTSTSTPTPTPTPAPTLVATLAPAARGQRLAGILAGLTTEAESVPVALPTPAELRQRTLAAAKKAQAVSEAKAAAEAKAVALARDTAIAKEQEAAQAAATKRAPVRVWVQVATGADERALPGTWSRLRDNHAALKGRAAAYVPFKATNRLLVGPLKSAAEARVLMNALAKDGVPASTFTSEAGQEVARLGGQ